MKKIFQIIAISFILTSYVNSAETSSGIVTGGNIYELPHWFKSSFLDFGDEIEDAKEQGKHVMAFMHLDECPYCARMLKESFLEGQSQTFMEANFDVIGLNVRGDLEVTWIDGNNYTERELTEHLRAVATPTIIFLDLDGNKVLQLNGYRDPQSFLHALEYVQSKRYVEESYSDYLSRLEKTDIYDFRSHAMLQTVTYLKNYSEPLLVLFEDKQCVECDRYHEKTLNHPDVLAAMEGFLFVRFDADSSQKLVTLDGRVTTASKWAKELDVTFRPALVFFNSGEEKFRTDGIYYHHHLSEALIYIKEGYRSFENIDDFKAAHREALLKAGKNVDFSE